jgi:hypothetical protein
MAEEIKRELLRLLREDEEFRYAVAGLIGLEEVLRRLDRHGEELVRLREDMNKLGKEMSELRKETNKLREDMNKLREDMNKLREDMNRGFELMERRLSALGARWGIMTEEAFREGLRGILERELGLKVERWSHRDEGGLVYGYPADIEVDIAVKDRKLILVEVTSHARRADVGALARKAELYREATGRRPDRVLMVTPYIEEEAFDMAKLLHIEVYTKV